MQVGTQIRATIWWFALVLGLSMSLLTGCISDPEIVELEDTLRAYERAVRWSNFQMIPAFRNKERSNEVLEYDRLKSIRVTGYAVRQYTIAESGVEADQVVEIRYYDENVVREKVEMDLQKWAYDDDLNHWVITSDLPKFIYP